jgi:hypothetical protein
MPEFRFEVPACPRCGAEARAIVERLVCYALLQPANDGGHDYADETKLDWDSQRVEVSADGECLLLGVCDHIWPSAFEVPSTPANVAQPPALPQEFLHG